MTAKASHKNLLLYLLTAIVFAVGGFLWTTGLELDPPMHVSHLGQSLSTDPAHCVYHARNYVKFDDSDPFDYTEWLVFQRSLVSLTAYAWFSVAGVSYAKANMVGVLLSLAALVLFILAIARRHRPWVALVFALSFLASPSLIIHGRLPYLENGLLFFVALLFFVQSRWSDTPWGPYLSGALVAAGMLMGKLFGILLLPALLLAHWFAGGDRRIRRTVACLGGFVGMAVVLVFVLYSKDLSAAYRHYVAGTYSLHGYPDGLTSPWAAVEHLLSYGAENRLFFLDLQLFAFLWLGGFLLTYVMTAGIGPNRLSPVVRLALFAVPTILCGIMPLNYSPLRYGVILIPLSAVLCFGLFDHLSTAEFSPPKKTGYARFIVMGLVVWHILFHLIAILATVDSDRIGLLTWTSFPVAVAVTLLIRYLFIRRKLILGKRVLYGILVVVVTVSAATNAYTIKGRLLTSANVSISDAAADLSQILGPDAVLAGPYASVFTLDNDLKSFIHFFGVVEVDSTLFERYPITHLAIDSSSRAEAVRNYPALGEMRPLTSYCIRDFVIRICPVTDIVGNPRASNYQKTGYERAADHLYLGNVDSALIELQAFLIQQPTCRSASLTMVDLLMTARRFEQATAILTGLAARYPTDYYTNLTCARCFQIMGLLRNDNSMLTLAQRHYQKAAQGNQSRAEQARALSQQIYQQYGPGARSGGDSP